MVFVCSEVSLETLVCLAMLRSDETIIISVYCNINVRIENIAWTTVDTIAASLKYADLHDITTLGTMLARIIAFIFSSVRYSLDPVNSSRVYSPIIP